MRKHCNLNDRENQVLTFRFGLNKTFSQIAEILGVSAGYVHKIEQNAIKKLRNINDLQVNSEDVESLTSNQLKYKAKN